MSTPVQQGQMDSASLEGREQQAQQQPQMMEFFHNVPQQQIIEAHGAALFPPLAHPPIHIPNRDDENPSLSGMISLAQHQHEIKVLRAAHEQTVKRLNTEIVDLKRKLKLAKETERETKRKSQEQIKEALKGRNKVQRRGVMDIASSNKHDIKWRERYEELKAFVEVYGHANVSKSEERYRNLWQW